MHKFHHHKENLTLANTDVDFIYRIEALTHAHDHHYRQQGIQAFWKWKTPCNGSNL